MNKDVLLTASGMAMLLTGNKLSALSMFGKGLANLERRWRENNPDCPPGIQARWDRALQFYDQSHQNPTNRRLHRIGIPMIVGGAAGLLIGKPLRPLWALSALSFTAGWALNFAGHYVEKSRPAFADDPLSFIAGPVWDWQQMRLGAAGRKAKVTASEKPAVAPVVLGTATTLN